LLFLEKLAKKMKQTNLIITFAVFLILLSCNINKNKTSQKRSMKITYPTTKKGNVIDTYFDEKVADPYRWLEDDRSPETEAWVKAQNKVTFDYLSKIPMRKKLQKELEQVWNYEKISAPKKHGEYLYFSKNDGLQNQWVIYRQKKNQEPEIFLNPNTFSKDGTTSLGTMSYTKDGKLLAYSISEGGSDWRKIIVLNTNTKKILGDTLKDVKFSGISWYKNEGFYYSSYDKPKGSELSAKTDQHKLYYHKLGTKQSEDKIIFGDKTKRRYVGGRVSNDNDYLIITAAKSTSGNELYIKDLTNPKNDIITILNHFDSDTYFIDNQENKLFFETNLKAPNKRLVSIDFDNPSPNNWKDIISETKEVLSISKGAGYFFAKYMIDAISKVKQYSYEGKLIQEIKLPAKGTANGFSGKSNDTVLYFGFTNYITPYSIYQLDPKTGKLNIYNKPKVAFNGTNFESKQVFYTSKDGTKIPMIITYKKGITLNGKNPTILYGYGGFDISITPSFNVANTVWLNNGGIYAVANIRGGGEYGRAWHDSGIQQKKQNVFDDFITAAEYLIAQNYTSSNYLAIQGRSNGGLLVGAVLTQRPDLIKVALPGVGVLDMLRYHTFTAGAGWAYDYGTSEQSKEMFQYLKNYSPVHNVKKGVVYPATLITTGDHDDRVVPAHSFKFAAELQEKQTGENPILIRIETNAGHGAGTPTAKLIQQNADNFAFTFYNMGIE
jgi:prolyl oligopeptidase